METFSEADSGLAHDADKLVLSTRELQLVGNQIVSEEIEDFLPAFLQESKTSLTARWIGEGPMVDESAGQRRVIRLQRVLSFDEPADAHACFPDLSTDELTLTEEGWAEVVSGEVTFALLRSKDGTAMRVGLEKLFARHAVEPIPRVLPADEPLPVILSISLRYVHGEEETSRTIVFAETIDVTEGDFISSGQLSDWIAVPPGSVPHSIRIGVVGREELNFFAKTIRDTGLGIFDMANKVRGAGVL